MGDDLTLEQALDVLDRHGINDIPLAPQTARAILTLESRIAEVERERDGWRDATTQAEGQRNDAEKGLADAHRILKRAVRIREAAREVVAAHALCDELRAERKPWDSQWRNEVLTAADRCKAALAALSLALSPTPTEGGG